MECVICGGSDWEIVHRYETPDKYEQWCWLTNVIREWLRCADCKHYQSTSNYAPAVFWELYEKGYRSNDFRGEDVKAIFNRIINLPHDQSENYQRVQWFLTVNSGYTVLDVGSGLGVFPYELKKCGFDIRCTEPNRDSRKFINEVLDIECFAEAPIKTKFDMVSIIHVLEHIEQPLEFLKGWKNFINPGGQIFIEVPDAVEFKTMAEQIATHDDFNSTHLHFFTTPSLFKLVEMAGFDVTDIHRVCYGEKRRIMLVGNNINTVRI